ncbi:MAG TPA: CHAT domain-containing protein, partial [Thermoanaerobaculia bacterium]|nr:CHAT domain-containing protein [Thermoanaerobaculia bacterium]
MQLARKVHDEELIAYFLKNSGDVYRQQGDFDPADAALSEAVAIADRRDVKQVRWMARNQLGLLWSKRDPARAEREFNGAFALIEEEQSGVLLEDFRPGFFEGEVRYANPYDQAAEFYLDQNRPADAFYVVARERARVFLETLAANRDRVRAAVPPGYAASEQSAIDRIKAAQSSLRTESLTPPQRDALMTAVERAESDLTALRLRLAIEQPSLANSRYPKLWHIDALQKQILRPDEALVVFHLPHAFHGGDVHGTVWVVRRDRVTAMRLPSRTAIEPMARAAVAELRSPYAQRQTAVAALSRALGIDAIANAAASRRLVIVPDGILHDVPFEALFSRPRERLVERFAISYVPSASALAFLRSIAAAARPGTIVAVANPIVSSHDAAAVRQASLADVHALAPLPGTSNEVHAIADQFGRAVIMLEGARATRSQLGGSQLRDARILHFATHGFIDEDHPLRSGLVLTADRPGDDGLLQMRDIYAMRLDADLVTLSGCDTALGENVAGEGIIGLTRAFFFAGARSVTASLWSIEDRVTARFMSD